MELDGHAVAGIGAEINVDHVWTMALDLGGAVVSEHKLSLDVSAFPATEVLDRLAELVGQVALDLERRGTEPVGLTVGVAGLVDRERDLVTHGPNLGWHDVPVGDLVRARLGASYPVTVDNESNLATLAEATPGDPERQDILVLFGGVGMGGGIVADGRLLRGRQGYAGEFGHVIVEPQGRRCGCGRVGCWETVVGLRALLDMAADPDDPVRDPALHVDERLAELNRRADLGDTRTLDALAQVAGWLGAGAAVLVNALNPAAHRAQRLLRRGGRAPAAHPGDPAARGRARARRRRHAHRAVEARVHRVGPRRRRTVARGRLRRPDPGGAPYPRRRSRRGDREPDPLPPAAHCSR